RRILEGLPDYSSAIARAAALDVYGSAGSRHRRTPGQSGGCARYRRDVSRHNAGLYGDWQSCLNGPGITELERPGGKTMSAVELEQRKSANVERAKQVLR